MVTMTEKSKEYGTALFSLAMENQAEQEYAEALEVILAAFEETPEYIEFLASPGIPKTERIDAIEQAFGANLPEYVVSFVKLLCEKGHIRSFKACVHEYNKLLDVSKNVSVAKIVSAVELTDSEKERLKQKLEKMSGHFVELECTVDASLMGGLVIEMDGKVIDGSLQRRLQEVKEVMSR